MNPPATNTQATVAQLRARNELGWGEAALIGIPGGIGVGLLTAAPIVASIALVVAVVIGVGLWRGDHFVGASAYQDEVRDSDYSPIQRWAPLGGVVASMVTSAASPFEPLVDAGFAPEFQLAVVTAGVVGALTAGLKFESMRSYRMGQRRLAQLRGRKSSAAHDIELEPALNDDHLLPAPAHKEVLSALVAIGAIDGMRTSSGELERLLGHDVREELQQLRKAGYVDLNRQFGAKGETSYEVTLTRAL